MFTHDKFERRSPEVKLTLCYKENNHDMVVTITTIHTGNQYVVNTEEQKYPLEQGDPIDTRCFIIHALDLQNVFDYVALYLIKENVVIEYNLLSPRFRDQELHKSYILVSDDDDNVSTELSKIEEKLWRYLRLLKGLTVDDFRTERI